MSCKQTLSFKWVIGYVLKKHHSSWQDLGEIMSLTAVMMISLKLNISHVFKKIKVAQSCLVWVYAAVILINMMSRVGTIHNKIWLNRRVLSLWYFLDTPCTGWLNLPTIEKCRVCGQFLFLVSGIMIVSCLSFQIKTATYMTWGTNLVPRLEYHALHIMYYIYWVWNSITLACSPHTTTFLGTFN